MEGVGHTLIEVHGEIDIATADSLSGPVEKALQTSRSLIIDLADTTFMDSSGLAALLRARKKLQEVGGTITLRSPHERVLRILQLTGTDRLFDCERDPTAMPVAQAGGLNWEPVKEG